MAYTPALPAMDTSWTVGQYMPRMHALVEGMTDLAALRRFGEALLSEEWHSPYHTEDEHLYLYERVEARIEVLERRV